MRAALVVDDDLVEEAPCAPQSAHGRSHVSTVNGWSSKSRLLTRVYGGTA